MKKHLGFFIFMNSILLGLPATFIGSAYIMSKYGDFLGVTAFIIGLNLVFIGANYAMERG